MSKLNFESKIAGLTKDEKLELVKIFQEKIVLIFKSLSEPPEKKEEPPKRFDWN